MAVLPRPFFPPNSLIRILPFDPPILPSFYLVVALRLIRGPLIRTRGRTFRFVFLYLVNLAHIVLAFLLSFFLSLSFSLSLYAARAPKCTRIFKRYNRVALWKLMHSIVDLCTIRVEYIEILAVYEINFVHARWPRGRVTINNKRWTLLVASLCRPSAFPIFYTPFLVATCLIPLPSVYPPSSVAFFPSTRARFNRLIGGYPSYPSLAFDIY